MRFLLPEHLARAGRRDCWLALLKERGSLCLYMSLIGTLLFSCWVFVTGGGFLLEWFWKLPVKKKNKKRPKKLCKGQSSEKILKLLKFFSDAEGNCIQLASPVCVARLTWPRHCSKSVPLGWDLLQVAPWEVQLQRPDLATAFMQCHKPRWTVGTIWTLSKTALFWNGQGFRSAQHLLSRKYLLGREFFGKSDHSLRNLNGSSCDLTFFFSNLSFTILGLGTDFSKHTQAHNWGLPFPMLQSSACSPLRGGNVVQILSRSWLILLSFLKE